MKIILFVLSMMILFYLHNEQRIQRKESNECASEELRLLWQIKSNKSVILTVESKHNRHFVSYLSAQRTHLSLCGMNINLAA